MDASTSKKRILIPGGSFGGIYTARHLEGLFKCRSDVEIVLVSRDNFLLMTEGKCHGWGLSVRIGSNGAFTIAKAHAYGVEPYFEIVDMKYANKGS
jgi:hypothetical protein